MDQPLKFAVGAVVIIAFVVVVSVRVVSGSVAETQAHYSTTRTLATAKKVQDGNLR